MAAARRLRCHRSHNKPAMKHGGQHEFASSSLAQAGVSFPRQDDSRAWKYIFHAVRLRRRSAHRLDIGATFRAKEDQGPPHLYSGDKATGAATGITACHPVAIRATVGRRQRSVWWIVMDTTGLRPANPGAGKSWKAWQ